MEIGGLTTRILESLKRAGRSVRRDGKPVKDADEAHAIVQASLQAMRGQRLATLERLGVIPA
jgi:hypothetical protein